MLRLGSFMAAALLAGTPAYTQELTSEIDKIFSWATPEAPGCVVGVAQHGRQIVNRAYGMADLERKLSMSPATIFDIGSVQKQFVAAAVLLLVQDGRLSLTEDIRKHFPELPDYGHTITVDHLLTHTSGLRDWTGLLMMSSESERALPMVLRQRGLNFAPGEEMSYSNSGYVLLKELIARASGLSFSEFTHRRLFEPLGMTSTSYADELPDSVMNRALAYEKDGNGWRLACSSATSEAAAVPCSVRRGTSSSGMRR